ncbi:hypothetical protein [Streptomyces sp. NBC_00648]
MSVALRAAALMVGPNTGGTIEFMVARNNGGKDVWLTDGCRVVVPTKN